MNNFFLTMLAATSVAVVSGSADRSERARDGREEVGFDLATRATLGELSMQAQPEAEEVGDTMSTFDQPSTSAQPSQMRADDTLVRARGTTTPRSLMDRFADVVNVKDFGARGNGTTDDTAAVRAAYDAVLARGGGTIHFPVGEYRFNLAITASNIRLVGDGPSSAGPNKGTVFRSWIWTRPTIQIGNGTAAVENIALENFTLSGDGTTSTSDGLFIIGAHYIYVSKIGVLNYGRDNISITTSATQPTYFSHFVQIHSQYASRDAVRLDVGASWLTSVYFTGCTLWGSSKPSSRVATVLGTRLSTTNCWLEASASNKGVYLGYDSATHAKMPSWSGGASTILDSNSSSDNLIEIDNTNTALAGRRLTPIFVRGVEVDGKVKWTADGSSVDAGDSAGPGAIDRDTGRTILQYLGFNRYATVANDEPSPPLIRLQGKGVVGDEHLTLTQAQSRVGRVSSFVTVPTSATSPGNPGEWSADASFLYVCYAHNAWRRLPVSQW